MKNKILILNNKQIDYLNDIISETYMKKDDNDTVKSVVAIIDFLIQTQCEEISVTEKSILDNNEWSPVRVTAEDNDWR